MNSFELDRAEVRDLYVGNNETPEKEWKAIYNIDKESTSSIVSKGYNLIQHKEVMDGFLEACKNLNIKLDTRIRSSNDKFIMDVTFPDAKLYVKVGEEFIAGFRVGNSYDKSTSIFIVPRLVRLACSNGMVIEKGLIKGFSYRHNQQIALQFESYISKAINDTINSSEVLKAMINNCIGDSIEWELLDKLLTHQFAGKHKDEILKRLDPSKEITRWDLYNAVTNYATHGEQLKPSIEEYLQYKSQVLLSKNFDTLIAEIPPAN